MRSRRSHRRRTGNGTALGLDLNPAGIVLRIVSDRGQNLRQPFGPEGVAAAACTNKDLEPTTATSLFVINTAVDQVALRSPASSGSLAATGALGLDAPSRAGFDIYSELVDGTTVSATGFATFTTDGDVALYSVDLLTGAAAERGSFEQPVTDLTIALG